MEKVQSVNRSMNIPRQLSNSNEDIQRGPETFKLHVNGIIESAKVYINVFILKFYSGDAIYCKYDFIYGTDWETELVRNINCLSYL